jgi:hypothetical protein
MDRKEALDFLGLADNADREQISEAIREKEYYYQTLYDTTAIPKLKDIYQKNIQTLALIKNLFGSSHNESPARKTTAGYASSPSLNAQPGYAPAGDAGAIAWLIRHTENMASASYNLQPGECVIGRHPVDGKNCITVAEDPYVSRYHARLIARPIGNGYSFEIYDDGLYSGNKPSKNGTYLNGSDNRIPQHEGWLLKEGDTIQIGVTKFVLRVNNRQSDVRQVVDEVSRTQYIKTVVIDLMS